MVKSLKTSQTVGELIAFFEQFPKDKKVNFRIRGQGYQISDYTWMDGTMSDATSIEVYDLDTYLNIEFD